MRLDTTTKSLEIVLDGAVTTNELDWVASYDDLSQTGADVINLPSSDGTTNGATAVTMVSAPAESVTRNLKTLEVCNLDTVTQNVTIQLNNNSTIRVLVDAYPLGVGETLFYVGNNTWAVLKPDNSILPVSLGGTGSGTAAGARVNLGLEYDVDILSIATYDPAGVAEQLLGETASQTVTNKTITDTSNDVDADDVRFPARNVSGTLIPKGTPVYQSGYNVGQELLEVEPANATSSATMPCIGITQQDIANNANGTIVAIGILEDVDTSAFSAGDVLYVDTTAGDFTTTLPTAANSIVQPVAEVIRSNATNGVLQVVNPGNVKVFTGQEIEILKDYAATGPLLSLSFFLNNTASDIGGIYYEMTTNDLGEAASTLVKSAIAAGDDQAFYNWASPSGGLGITRLQEGIYQFNLNLERTGGNRTLTVYAEIYYLTSGGTETLVATTGNSSEITSQAFYALEASVPSDVIIGATDRLVIKLYVNASVSGTASELTIHMEDDTDSRFSIPATTSVLSNIFLRQDNNLSDLDSASTARTNLGVAIGTDVQAWDADLDTYSANPLTAAELGQLQNIGTTTISATQWGYLGAADQATATTDNVTFANLTATELFTDTISEETTDAGVTIDGLLVKDGGIYLDGIAAANLLDRHEKGLWSPTLVPSGGSFASVTYNSATGGRYEITGDVCHIQGRVLTNAVDTSGGSGNVRVGNLPFVAVSSTGSTSDGLSAIALSRVQNWAGENPISAYVNEGENELLLWYRTAVDGDEQTVFIPDVGTGAGANSVVFGGTYIAA